MRLATGVNKKVLVAQHAANRHAYLSMLPLLWVLDDDYIPAAVSCKSQLSVMADHKDTNVWLAPARVHQRESNLLCALKAMPGSAPLLDAARLDALLEDYLDEALLFNQHVSDHAGSIVKRKPLVDTSKLIYMDHWTRLDLSVVLTLSVIMDIPVDIFAKGILRRVHPHYTLQEVVDMLSLPLFAKTALVSLIRRICNQEKDEFAVQGGLRPKPKRTTGPKWPGGIDVCAPPLYTGGRGGFRHLALCKQYLDDASSVSISSTHIDKSVPQFSDLEIELLRILPDAPTRAESIQVHEQVATAAAAGGEQSYSSWVSLSARHSIILISRSIDIPTLTKAQTSKNRQDDYLKLLPALVAARMSYDDLGVANTGPQIDGRPARMRSVDGKSVSRKNQVLPFGAGLPKGNHKLLSWNREAVSSKVSAVPPAAKTRKQPLVDAHLRRSMTDATGEDEKFNDDITASVDMPSGGGAEDASMSSAGMHSRANQSHPRGSAEAAAAAAATLQARPLMVYSADVMWDPSFLLAPTAAVEAHNRTLTETHGWRSLDHAPVALQFRGSPEALRKLAASGSPDQLTRGRDNALSDYAAAAAEPSRQMYSPTAYSAHLDAPQPRAAEPAPYLMLDKSENAEILTRLQSVINDDNVDVKDDVSEHSDNSEAEVQKFVQEQIARIDWGDFEDTNEPTIRDMVRTAKELRKSTGDLFFTPAEKQFGGPTVSLDAQRDALLREMGTLRNSRSLAEFNRELLEASRDQKMRIDQKRMRHSVLAQKLSPSATAASFMPNASLASLSTSLSFRKAAKSPPRSAGRKPTGGLNWLKALAAPAETTPREIWFRLLPDVEV
jgi:hypothetical protein